MSPLSPGQSILHYRIGHQLGKGGMGEVYRADDLKLSRSVAIKILPPEVAPNQTTRQRFVREARLASALNHPHIVTIHSIEEVEGLAFIVMELVEGESLRARIARGPIDLPHVLDWGAQVADGLAAAHAIGLVHRDMKPENILITPRDQAKVLDFGLAKVVGPPTGPDTDTATLEPGLTAAGVVIGTAAYMSPEQTRGEPLDARSDVFSLGVVLYEAATGRLPFTGASLLSLMHDIAVTDPPSPSRVRSGLPREFDIIIERALAKDKEQRPASALELADALQRVRGSTTSPAVPVVAGTEPESAAETFVGRGPELERLARFFSEAVDGTGRVVFITGELGIGKSALANEFMRRARQQPSILCRGRCAEQYGTGEAYLPFLDALGALLTRAGHERIVATLRTRAPTWCLQFPASFSSTGALEQLHRDTIGATKERMLREMSDALEALAATAPVVLLLEDLHWADLSSVDLLRYLAQRAGTQRLLVVGTFRPEDVERSNHSLKNAKREMQAHQQCEEVALTLLDAEHIASYLDARFAPNDFSRELVSEIQRKTEGHPLFATSLVQFLVERGDIAKTNGQWTLLRPLSEMELEIPESVRGMVRKKVEVLEEEDRRALQYASVEGEDFMSTVAARLLAVDEVALEERLDRLDRVHRLIETRGEEELPDGTVATRYRFAHVLYQNVLYEELVSKRRISLHRQAGEYLVAAYGNDAPRIASQLAMHFERGREFSRAIEYLTHAGDNATKIYAYDEAEKHYTRALDLTDRIPLAPQSERYSSLYLKRGIVNRALSRFDQAIDDFTRMLERARAAGSPALEHAALNALATTLFWSHRIDEMLARATDAARVAEASGSQALQLETMCVMAQKHQCYGEPAEGKPLAEEIVRVARALGHSPALLGGLINRGMWHYFQSEYELAEQGLREARTLASDLRDGLMLLLVHFGLGLVLGNLGRMSEALQLLNEAMRMARRNGDHFTLPRLPNCIGWIHRELQDVGHARAHDQHGVELARTDHVLEAEANSLINLGYDHTLDGQTDAPLAAFREAASIFERDAWFRWRYNIRLQAGQAEYWLARADLEQAERYGRRLLETASHYEARKYIAVAHKLLAEVAVARGDVSAAGIEFEAALNLLRQYPVPIVTWKTYAALGRLRAQTGDGPAASAAFAAAAEIIGQIAGHVTDDILRNTFLGSGAAREVLAGAGG